MGAYNPISYHNGSVWPHDNALIAAGLMRYGFVEEAQRIATAVLDAADAFGGRLPELFCGFDRATYPAAGALPDLLLAAGLGRRHARPAAAHAAADRPVHVPPPAVARPGLAGSVRPADRREPRSRWIAAGDQRGR